MPNGSVSTTFLEHCFAC